MELYETLIWHLKSGGADLRLVAEAIKGPPPEKPKPYRGPGYVDPWDEEDQANEFFLKRNRRNFGLSALVAAVRDPEILEAINKLSETLKEQ